MTTQYLFAYGTLKSDQPEHALHCEPPVAIRSARAPGCLWRLREGYPILQIDPRFCLADATIDAASDWHQTHRREPQPTSLAEWLGPWTEGELFEYPLEKPVLGRMDAWENFQPGRPGVYQRRIIWTQDEQQRPRPAWAYVCYTPPNWATLHPASRWR